MAAAGNYITQCDVEARLTAAAVRLVYDDDGSGAIAAGDEGNALRDIILDAENLVEESIRKTYGEAGFTWMREQGVAVPRSIKRRCLDAARLYIFERHPTYIRIDFNQAWGRFEKDLERLRVREVELAVAAGASPEPAMNEGGDIQSGDPDDTDPREKEYLDGLSAF